MRNGRSTLHATAFHMKNDASRGDHRARAAQQVPSPGPAVDGADADAHRMQAPGRDDEAHAVEQRALARRQFGAVRMAVEDREASDHQRRDDQRRPHLEGDCGSEHDGRRGDPDSTPGIGTPRNPSMPPIAMTSGNATGSTQIAGAPSCAPHRPTATIASTWSRPGERMQQACEQSVRLALLDVAPGPTCVQTRRQQAPAPAPIERCMARRLHRSAAINNAMRWIVQNAPSVPTI